MDSKTLYQKLKEANIPIDSYQSDLYALVSPVSRAIINDYEFKCNVTTFKSQTDKMMWFEIPFAYTPYWEKLGQNSLGSQQ